MVICACPPGTMAPDQGDRLPTCRQPAGRRCSPRRHTASSGCRPGQAQRIPGRIRRNCISTMPPGRIEAEPSHRSVRPRLTPTAHNLSRGLAERPHRLSVWTSPFHGENRVRFRWVTSKIHSWISPCTWSPELRYRIGYTHCRTFTDWSGIDPRRAAPKSGHRPEKQSKSPARLGRVRFLQHSLLP